MRIAWVSCGAASAVACKIELNNHPDTRLVYEYIDTAHPDNERFLADLEKWYGKKIEIISSRFYRNQFDVIERVRYINSPHGAPCSPHLKKNVRKEFEAANKNITSQIFGMTIGRREEQRAIRLIEKGEPFEFPLIENRISKNDCYKILLRAGIELPMMYRLGFNNNNCIACPKGGQAYWLLIKKHFKEYFDRMVALEEKIGATCINGHSLKSLKPGMGRHKMPDLSCDAFCTSGFYDI